MYCYVTGNDVDWYQELGFTAFKLACPYGPADGLDGLRKNEAFVAATREQIGDECELMLDCWMAFDVDYTVRLAEALRPYRLKWMEECLMPEDMDAHGELRQRLPWQTLATGEHWYSYVPFQSGHCQSPGRHLAAGHQLVRRADDLPEDCGHGRSRRHQRHAPRRRAQSLWPALHLRRGWRALAGVLHRLAPGRAPGRGAAHPRSSRGQERLPGSQRRARLWHGDIGGVVGAVLVEGRWSIVGCKSQSSIFNLISLRLQSSVFTLLGKFCMIIDSHCHAWATWPYDATVPDGATRGSAAQLEYAMAQNDVDRALIVCAQIEWNPENNAYVAEACRRDPQRLLQLVDLDSRWSAHYHTPGAAGRLQTMLARWSPVGFTHYLRDEDDGGWLTSPDGLALFALAAEAKLLASIHCRPYQQPAIRAVAERFPTVPLLIHHLGHPQSDNADDLAQIVASARCPNIYLKVSGFYYGTRCSEVGFPANDMQPVVRTLYDVYGPTRMCWGSDFPVVSQFMTYRQSLEIFRSHCSFIPPADQAWILGRTLAQLLENAGKIVTESSPDMTES